MRIRAVGGRGAIVILLGVALYAGDTWAHAFPERSEPRVGATVRTAPTRVQIWFDGDLEPAFSRLTVTDGRGARVDRGDSQVDPQNRRVLRVTLPPIAARDLQGQLGRARRGRAPHRGRLYIHAQARRVIVATR